MDNDNDIEEGGNSASTAKSKGISEYTQRREKNIVELKEILKGLEVPKLRCVITMHHMHHMCDNSAAPFKLSMTRKLMKTYLLHLL